MCSIAYTAGDPVALAKALTAYAKANPSFTFPRGHGGRPRGRRGRYPGAGQPAGEGTDLREVVFLINAPAQRIVTAVGGVGRNLAVVVDQGVKENKFS